MPDKRSHTLTILFTGYAISLALMALGGWSLYGLLDVVLSSTAITQLRLFQATLFALSFLVFAFTAQRVRWSWRIVACICTGLFISGLILIVGALYIASASALLAFVAAIMLSVARAGFLTLWVGLVGALSSSDPGKGLVGAWIASSLFLVVACFGFGNAFFMVSLALLFVAADWALLLICIRRLPSYDKKPEREAGVEAGSFWRGAWPLILFGALLSFCAEIISRMTLSADIWINFPPSWVTSVCKLIVACALLAIWKRFGKVETLSKVFPSLYFLVITCCVPLSFFGEGFLAFAGIVTSLVSAAFTILMTVACVNEGRERGVSPIPSFCLFAGLFYLGMVLGDFVGVISSYMAGSAASFYSAITLACVYVLSVGFFLFNRIHDKKKKASAKPIVKELVVDQDAQRTEALVQRYRLSQRERDVLYLLAQGRDAPFIAKTLYISENTVRSHIKKIYAKVGIHSRQELFDLIHSQQHDSLRT